MREGHAALQVRPLPHVQLVEEAGQRGLDVGAEERRVLDNCARAVQNVGQQAEQSHLKGRGGVQGEEGGREDDVFLQTPLSVLSSAKPIAIFLMEARSSVSAASMATKSSHFRCDSVAFLAPRSCALARSI